MKILVQKKVLVILLIATTLPLFITDSYGHGIGYEVFHPVQVGEKRVALEVTSSQYQNPDNSVREISFALFDTETGITVKDVTYSIGTIKKDLVLFDNTFDTGDES